jgi:hypothetical protein
LHTGRSYRAMLVSEHLKLKAFARAAATPAGQPHAEPWDPSRLPFVLRAEVEGKPRPEHQSSDAATEAATKAIADALPNEARRIERVWNGRAERHEAIVTDAVTCAEDAGWDSADEADCDDDDGFAVYNAAVPTVTSVTDGAPETEHAVADIGSFHRGHAVEGLAGRQAGVATSREPPSAVISATDGDAADAGRLEEDDSGDDMLSMF